MKTTQASFLLSTFLVVSLLCQKVEAEGQKVGPNTYVYNCPSPPFCYDNLKGVTHLFADQQLKSVRITFLERQTPEEFAAKSPKFRLSSKVVQPPTEVHREHKFIGNQ